MNITGMNVSRILQQRGDSKMCNCIEKMKESWKDKGMFDVSFDDMSVTSILIPFTYRVKNDKTGEFTKKVWHRKYISKYCPFCGQQLRDGE